MKMSGLWAALWVAAMLPLSAQVTVEVTQRQEQFLPGEAMPVAVRITNHSGQTLHLGAEENWLTFSMESREGSVVPRTGEVPVTGAFELPSSKVATKRVDLAPYFPLSRAGRYKIIATVKIKEWGQDITSPPRSFDVIEGVSVWEQPFGVPKAPGATEASPEVRRYVLQQANYIRGELRLYLRVTDATGTRNLHVVRVGTLLSFSRPEHLLDQASNLHVLYQDAPHSFAYVVFDPDGDTLVHQTYDYAGTRPRLRAEADGKISVFGGARRASASDIPASKSPPSAETAAPAKAADETQTTEP